MTEPASNQFIPTTIVNLKYRETQHFQKNQFFFAKKSETIEGKCDVSDI